jgi:hypothetical protein
MALTRHGRVGIGTGYGSNCGFEPRTEHAQHGPIVYGLGSGVFTPGNGVRLPVGLPRGGVTGTCRAHNPGDEGSSPSCATNLVSPNGRAADR